MFRRWTPQKQRVSVSNVAKAGETSAFIVNKHDTSFNFHEINDRSEPFEQHLQRDELIASEEAKIPSDKRKKSQHDVRDHNERLHRLLAAIFRPSLGQAVRLRPRRHSSVSIQPIPMARLLQQSSKPHNLRDLEQGLPETIPRDPLLPLQ